MKQKVLLLVSMLFAVQSAMWACTNLIVGKKASTDGSVIVSYSADSFGSFGFMCRYPAGKHPKGTMRPVYDWESNKYLGEIEEAAETYSVLGNMNEHQLTITETTFGGRPELVDTTGLLDYGSLIYITLQRARTAREAIDVMTGLIDRYGYNSSGESITLADPNEAWIMELIGKGPGRKGAVWVAVRVPDDCISAHANHSRIHQFPLKDKKNCVYSKDVIRFAREQGYFDGKDSEFSFSKAYAPANFSALRFCEARVWSFFNRYADGMAAYLDYAMGDATKQPMPLFVKPKQKVSVQNIKDMMRDHYEGTPMAMDQDISAGPYEAPHRPTPLTWKVDGKTYFNERPIGTQQSAFVLVTQMRNWLPDYVGGVQWFGCDDAGMIALTPVYCGNMDVPECYDIKQGDIFTFSFKSAFWMCNWVSNMVYPRYKDLIGELQMVRDRLEQDYNNQQAEIEKQALDLAGDDGSQSEQARAFLTKYSNGAGQKMMDSWMSLGQRLIVRYNDGLILKEQDGQYVRGEGGGPVSPERKGYPERFRKQIVKETGDRYLVPAEK